MNFIDDAARYADVEEDDGTSTSSRVTRVPSSRRTTDTTTSGRITSAAAAESANLRICELRGCGCMGVWGCGGVSFRTVMKFRETGI
eukprot:COSAG01_NODE_230_length_21075_cov_13.811603_30_plen_87_part_00